MMLSSQTSYYDMLTPQLLAFYHFSAEIIMNSSVRLLAVALSFFVAQQSATHQIGSDSQLRGLSGETPSLASILQIESDSHLRGNNDHAPTPIMLAPIIQIENYSHLRGGSQSSTLVSPQSHNSSPHLRSRDTNTTTGPAFDLDTRSRLRRTEL
jgi:hypothetical protein